MDAASWLRVARLIVSNNVTRWREQFESMRLLYVAATRAQDRLILSGRRKTSKSSAPRATPGLTGSGKLLNCLHRNDSGIVDLEEQDKRSNRAVRADAQRRRESSQGSQSLAQLDEGAGTAVRTSRGSDLRSSPQ